MEDRPAAAPRPVHGIDLSEAMIARLRATPGAEGIGVTVGPERLGFDEYGVATQSVTSHHYRPGGDGRYTGRSIPFRYVWPAELDLMARLAGMTLRSRWADRSGVPFTDDSTSHVSVRVRS